MLCDPSIYGGLLLSSLDFFGFYSLRKILVGFLLILFLGITCSSNSFHNFVSQNPHARPLPPCLSKLSAHCGYYTRWVSDN